MILRIRYYPQDYGGQCSIEMLRIIVRNMMSDRGLENTTEGMRCP
jgi:uncharacterized protein (DUF433 family)